MEVNKRLIAMCKDLLESLHMVRMFMRLILTKSNLKGFGMPDFPTDKKPFTYNSIKFYIVQCFRPNKGYTLLAHIGKGYATWCLIVADDAVERVRGAFDFKALLMEVV